MDLNKTYEGDYLKLIDELPKGLISCAVICPEFDDEWDLDNPFYIDEFL